MLHSKIYYICQLIALSLLYNAIIIPIMYHIPHFKASNDQEVLDFMKAHPFAMLCGVAENGFPVATHIPVLVEEREGTLFILGHLMRKQEHTLAFEKNNQALLVFSGPHAYVSASWYEDQAVASTWNYAAVHATGLLHFLNDEDLLALLIKLTDTFEGTSQSPAAVKNMSPEYLKQNMKAICGFEIEIKKLQHVYKLSQNKDEKSYHHIIEQLGATGNHQDQSLAKIMATRSHDVFLK